MEINKKIVAVKNVDEKPDVNSPKVRKQLMCRDNELYGVTRKLKTPLAENSMFITINHIERDGKKIPFEVFIQSKEVAYQQWITGLARMISLSLRLSCTYNFNASDIVSELSAVSSATGSYLKKGKVVTSVVSEIGDILKEHFENIGYIEVEKTEIPEYVQEKIKEVEKNPELIKNIKQCPRCNSVALYKIDGCESCGQCGYSKCG